MVRLNMNKAEEEVSNLNRRATEAKMLARRRKIEVAMRNRPGCIEPLWEKLTSLFPEELIMTKEEETMTPSCQAKAVAKRKVRRASQEAKAVSDCALAAQGGARQRRRRRRRPRVGGHESWKCRRLDHHCSS